MSNTLRVGGAGRRPDASAATEAPRKSPSPPRALLALAVAGVFFGASSEAGERVLGGLEPYGEVAVTRFADGGGTSTLEEFWYGDIGIRTRPFDAGGLKLGAYAGYEGFGTFREGYLDLGYSTAALVIGSGPHEVSLGSPRSVVNDVVGKGERIVSDLIFLELNLIGDLSRYLRLLFGETASDRLSLYGVRYDGRWSDTRIITGAFTNSSLGPTVNTVALAASRTIGDTELRAAFEQVDIVGESALTSATIGATSVRGKVTFGIDASGVQANTQETFGSVNLFANYQLREKLRIGSTYAVSFDEYDSLEVFTLGAEYSPTEATFLRVTGTSPSDLELFELAFGLRF